MSDTTAEISIERVREAEAAIWPQAKPPSVAPIIPLARNTAVPLARTQSGSAPCAVTLSVLKAAVQAAPPAKAAGTASHCEVASDIAKVPPACSTVHSVRN